jgi:endothelin-converting enzyme/putative endopeptidase
MVHTRATFLLSWATIWRSKARDEATKNQVKTDPHSPGMYRAYVPLQNVDTFIRRSVFKNDGMYIVQRKELKSGNKIFKKKSQVSAWDF